MYCVFGTLLVDLGDGVSQISSECDSDNESEVPAVPSDLPKELASIMPSSFVEVAIRFRSRLEKVFRQSYINALEAVHESLRDRYLQYSLLEDMLYYMKHTVGCHDVSFSLRSQILTLREF